MTRSILLVEDEEPLRDLLASVLRKRGHRVLESGDAEGVVQHLLREPSFDLLITDVHLPGLSGIELMRLLQSHSPTKPVLVITGDSDRAIARDVLQQGAAGYLLKPFELSELEAVVDRGLRQVELLERAGEGQPLAVVPQVFGVPVDWLELADRRSGAGPGHGRRVQRLVAVLAELAKSPDVNELEAAARLHELGRLVSPDVGGEAVPAATARLLDETAVPSRVRELIAEMPELGRGRGQDGAAPSVLLAMAHRMDHLAIGELADGEVPGRAIRHAIESVKQEVDERYGAGANATLASAEEILSALWVLGRGRHAPDAPDTGVQSDRSARRPTE